MKKYGLSEGYQLLEILNDQRKTPALDRAMIREEILGADQELEKVFASLEKYVGEALDCLRNNKNIDYDLLEEKIVYLRMQAMRVESLFSNFVEFLDSVLKDGTHPNA